MAIMIIYGQATSEPTRFRHQSNYRHCDYCPHYLSYHGVIGASDGNDTQ